VANICPSCNGDGKESKDNTVMVDCSKILTHASLVFKDDGNYNMLSGTYSNLVIHLSTKPHPMFKRVDQLSISTIVNISLPSALMGYSGIITHPSGRRVPFSEPPGILDGDTCIVDGEGLSSNGDLLIIFKITKTIMDVKMIEEVSEIFKKYNL
jgi:DnaJ-class molecular chaperone